MEPIQVNNGESPSGKAPGFGPGMRGFESLLPSQYNLSNMQHDEKPAREIDDTAGSAAEDRFEDFMKRVKAAGAEIEKDETGPLYVDLGQEEVEIGEQRIVEFNLNRMDFQVTRNVKTIRITGEGHKKSFEDLSRPIIDIKLKRKPDTSDQWVIMDLEDMF